MLKNKTLNILLLLLAVFAIVLISLTAAVKVEQKNATYDIELRLDGDNGYVIKQNANADFLQKPKDPVKEGYRFLYWSETEEGKVPFDFEKPLEKPISKLFAVFERLSAQYSVEFQEENLDGTYTTFKTISDNIGNIGEIADTDHLKREIESSEREGFAFSSSTTGAIKEDGSTVLYVRYARKEYSVVYFLEGGSWTGDGIAPAHKYKHGSKVKHPVAIPVKSNYSFAYWSLEADGAEYDISAAVVSDMSMHAVYTKVRARYTVEFQKENLDGTYATFKTITENYGDIGKPATTDHLSVEIVDNTAEGFKYDSSTSEKLAADDSTVLYVKYARILYDIRINYNDDEDRVETLSIKYGAKISRPKDPAKAGYSFKHWSREDGGESAFDFELYAVDSAFSLYAVYDPLEVEYKIVYKKQDAYYDHYNKDREETTKGYTGRMTAVTAPAEVGFIPLNITQQIIKADGTTVVEVKYDRQLIDVTFAIAPSDSAMCFKNVQQAGEWSSRVIKTRYGAIPNDALETLVPVPKDSTKPQFHKTFCYYANLDVDYNGEVREYDRTPVTSAITLTAVFDLTQYTITLNFVEEGNTLNELQPSETRTVYKNSWFYLKPGEYSYVNNRMLLNREEVSQHITDNKVIELKYTDQDVM